MSTTPMRVHGADLSHHNVRPNLVLAKQHGLQWLYHKATEGATVKDTAYPARRKLAAEAGIPFGAYHFARPDRDKKDAVEEARFFMKNASPKAGDLVPVLDMEVLGSEKLESWSKAFMAEVQRLLKEAGLTGTPMHYGPDDFGKDYPFLRWVPRYNNDNRKPSVHWDIWQFSDGIHGLPKSHPGLGRVDLNTMRPGLKLADFQLKKIEVKKPTPTPKPTPKPPTKPLLFDVGLMPSNKNLVPAMLLGDGKEAGGLLGNDGVLFTTELDSPDDRLNALHGLGPTWSNTCSNEASIFYGDQWELDPDLKSYTIVLHQGRPHVTPWRPLNVAFLRHKRTGKIVCFMGAHLVSEPWCIHPVKDKEWRREVWEISWKRIQTEVKMVHDRGIPVVFGGDLNTGKDKPGDKLVLHPDQLHAVSTNLDHIFFVPATIWSVTGHLVRDINSDHDFHRVTVGMRL